MGDAGYIRDPITAQGITDAFRDAELCAAALDRSFGGAMPPEMQQVLAAVHGNTEAMDGFASVAAGTVSPGDFFAPEHIGQVMAAAAARAGA